MLSDISAFDYTHEDLDKISDCSLRILIRAVERGWIKGPRNKPFRKSRIIWTGRNWEAVDAKGRTRDTFYPNLDADGKGWR